MNWPAVLLALIICCYALIIMGTTAYAVFWLGHSGWWFALAVLLCSVRVKSE